MRVEEDTGEEAGLERTATGDLRTKTLGDGEEEAAAAAARRDEQWDNDLQESWEELGMGSRARRREGRMDMLAEA